MRTIFLLFLTVATTFVHAQNAQDASSLMPGYEKAELLAAEDFADLSNWLTEGKVAAKIEDGRLFFESTDSAMDNPKGNIWWKQEFSSPFVLEFKYQSLTRHGLSMIFWNAYGVDGKDVFSWQRSGRYVEYVSGNLAAYHVSFHRFGTGVSNLRKAPGFHLVSTAADPIIADDPAVHKIVIASAGNRQRVFVDGKLVHDFIDRGQPCLSQNAWQHQLPCKGTGGPLMHGAIGIRHTQKQQAFYSDFRVYRLAPQKDEGVSAQAIIVDNADPGFSSVGKWNPSTRDKGFTGDGYLWCAAGDGSARAVFTPDLPRAGLYQVWVKWVASKPTDRATNAPYIVDSVDGKITIRVNIADLSLAGAWYKLGEFRFQGGKNGSVALTNDANNSVVADAIMFVLMDD